MGDPNDPVEQARLAGWYAINTQVQLTYNAADDLHSDRVSKVSAGINGDGSAPATLDELDLA